MVIDTNGVQHFESKIWARTFKFDMKRYWLFFLAIATSTLLFDLQGLAAVFKASRRLSGFSPDSRYYIYLESSRNPVTEVPTAQIQIIDVEKNSCISDGCQKTEYDRSSSNISNQAAENDLLTKTSPLRQALKLNQLKVGIPLPIVARSISPARTEAVQVRLDKQKQPIQISLQQRYRSLVSPGGDVTTEQSSMRLLIDYNYRRLTLGDLSNYRDAVKKYSIREVRLSPNGRNIVVLIDQTQATYEGVLQTTVVQSFPLEISKPS
jgi:predicted secreted protein